MPKVYDKANARTKPDWLKIRLTGNEEYADVAQFVAVVCALIRPSVGAVVRLPL